MSYRLDPAMPVSEALRSVALTELEIAHTALATPSDRHTGVHSARKCFKRLRSLLLLARPGMPDPVFVNLTARVARIGKGLAAARDAQALLDDMDDDAELLHKIPTLFQYDEGRRRRIAEWARREHSAEAHVHAYCRLLHELGEDRRS